MTTTKSLKPVHAVTYTELPTQWAEGLPLGNGEIGVMCWSDGRHLRFSLDSNSAWDLRTSSDGTPKTKLSYAEMVAFGDRGAYAELNETLDKLSSTCGNGMGPTKIYLGRMDLDVEFDAAADLSLSLREAAVRGKLNAAGRQHTLDAFVSRNTDVFSFRLDPWPENAKLSFAPFFETSPGLAKRGYPDMEITEKNGLKTALLQIPGKTFLAVCWNEFGPDIFVSFATASNAQEARQASLATHPDSTYKTFDAMFSAHREAWETFWAASGIALPEKDIDFLWHYGLYILSTSTRAGSNPPGLQGVWAMDGRVPPWNGDYHTDMNVQETFWSSYASGHLELVDVWLDFLYDLLPQVQDHTCRVFGARGAFQRCVIFPEFTQSGGAGGWWPCGMAMSNTGWLAQLAWLRWRYSKDTAWLAERGYPLVKSAFDFYSDILREEDDGYLHVPLSSSPEYCGPYPEAWCKDPNIDLALIRKCCDWIVEMEAALGQSELTTRAQEIRQKLVPYHLVAFDHPASYVRGSAPKGRCVLGLWKDKMIDYSHRHPSHLMAIHPAMDLTIEGSEETRVIIEASIKQFMSLGQFCWAGHTYAQMTSFAAVIGLPEMAYNFVKRFRDNWLLPNGLHFNREIGTKMDSRGSMAMTEITEKAPFTINETTGITCGISDMLLQGWGDKLRIFPAVPAVWKDILFTDLVAEGAFKVAALMRDGQTKWVRITATVDSPCQLRNPFGEEDFSVFGCVPGRKDDVLEWPMTAGQTVVFNVSGFDNPDLEHEAAEIRSKTVKWLCVEEN